ncbi:MAG: SsrA-binding protein [Vicingus serpentipes]|nr:SsrA-binding protein [Vicingus serpentipes]
MKTQFFKILAKINKVVLPSYTKQRLDLAKASKLQLAIFGWRIYVTKRALDNTQLLKENIMKKPLN